jgi:uncharacterized protein (DUF3084 family)
LKGKPMQDNRTSTEIDCEIDKLERDMKKYISHKGVIQDEYNQLKRDEIEIQQQKLEITKQRQDLKIRLDKARSLISDIESQIKLERRMFWTAKNSGL